MWVATSDSRAFFKFLFLILEVPILYSSGACFIPSSISFLLISEVIALEPTSSPFLNKFFAPNYIPRSASFLSPLLKKLPPFCACLVRLTVTFLCNCAHLFRCFLSPICLVHLTVTFLSKLRLLVLSYLATKVSLLCNVICLGVARLCSITVSLTVFCIFFFFSLFQKFF